MAPRGKVGRGSDQFMLRMPDGMREKLAEIAKLHGRSMNSEIIAILEKAIEDGDWLNEMYTDVQDLKERVRDLEESTGTRRFDRD